MKKIKTTFFCQNCGQESAKWLGKCPSCGEWNQFVEEEVRDTSSGGFLDEGFNEKPISIDIIKADEKDRLQTGIAEIDRVLGGGIVGGSAILIGGDPGIGKSTLLLQVMQNLAVSGLVSLYVSGEESASQIKLRGKRVGASSNNLMVLVEVSLENILRHIKEIHPGIVVIDLQDGPPPKGSSFELALEDRASPVSPAARPRARPTPDPSTSVAYDWKKEAYRDLGRAEPNVAGIGKPAASALLPYGDVVVTCPKRLVGAICPPVMP